MDLMTLAQTGKGFLALCLVLLSASLVVRAQEIIVAPGDPVVFGVAVGRSGEGIAPLGEDVQRGIEIAHAERPTLTLDAAEFAIRLDIQDSQCNAEGGVATATRFTSDPAIVAIIGPMCSSACTSAAPIYDGAGYATISPTCAAAELTRSGFSSFNRTISSASIQGSHAAHYVFADLGIGRVATIHDGSAFAESIAAVFTDTFRELGGEIVAADAVTVGDTQFQALLSEIAAAEPELLYFSGFPAEAARLLEQRYDVGLEEIPFFGASAWNGQEVLELAGEAVEGAIATAPIAAHASEAQQAAQQAFLDTFVETYGAAPVTPFPTNYYDAYQMLHAVVSAVAQVDEDGNLRLDRAALADALRRYGPVIALNGTLHCDGTGECIVSPTGIFQVRDGAFEQIGVVNP